MEPSGGDAEREIHERLIPKDEFEEIYTHEQLLHSIGSFSAIVWPVSVTMLLASFFSTNVQDPETAQVLANAYLVYSNPSDNDSNSTLIGHAFVNALVVICVVICVTFLMVALYKYNFFKCLAGYLVFSSALLLSDLGGHLAYMVLSQLQLSFPVVDVVSFLLGVYNFSVVGVLAIFYQKGLSPTLTQVYLVCSSVILAWQFSQFPEWTTWALLVLLAFYDLCAVLTPCGPLKCLVQLIQKEGKPLPGLLYEAKVSTTNTGFSARNKATRGPGTTTNGQDPYYQFAASEPWCSDGTDAGAGTKMAESHQADRIDLAKQVVQHNPVSLMMAETETERHALLRERLVRFYRQYNPNAIDRIDLIMNKYRNQEAKLWQDLYDKYVSEEDAESSIKLGLGDFIFYSVLVSRAAQYDFCAMVACLVAILMGLMGTMFLLGIYQSALPALPISILLAVSIYFWLYGTFVAFVSQALEIGVIY